uniref:Uncharacterized protein n=1 Tax=Meloidogyne enterolobii TaxID=390850 RepID=A0A6V7VT71_MELEN|nr:unnamed protein product [Meloidogyne enterolobii]
MSANFSDGLQMTNYVYYDMYVTYKNAGPSFMLCFMSIILNIIVIPGIFMNTAIIYVTIKYYKTLRGTSSFLLALNAFYEILHGFAHQVFLVSALSGRNFISYWTVFCWEVIPLWGCSSSVVTIALTGLDRLLQVSYPSWHENVKKKFYLGFMVIFSLGCGSLVALKFWDIATRFPDVPQTGTLSDVFLFEFKPLFFVFMGLCNSLSILFYIAIFVSVHRQTATNTAVCKESRNNAKLFKSMFTIVSVTIGCYLMSAAVRLVILPPFHLGEINVWIIELAFGTLLNLGVTLNAVVLYICSQEYRKCFNRELLLFGSIFGIIRRVSVFSVTGFRSTTLNNPEINNNNRTEGTKRNIKGNGNRVAPCDQF